jgi:hypothetical protein
MTEQTLTRLSHLTEDLIDAKGDEERARRNRIAIEEKIAALVPTSEKGQQTITLGNVKLTVKRDLSYTADLDAIEGLLTNPELPPPLKSKTTRELDVQGYEWYRANHPEVFTQLTEHVEVKPKKVAISVKPVKKAAKQ